MAKITKMTEKDIQIATRLDALVMRGAAIRTEADRRGEAWDYQFALDTLQLFVEVVNAFEGLEELPGNRGYWHDQFAVSLKAALGIPYCIAALDWCAQFTASAVGIPDFFPVNTASTQTFYGWGKKEGYRIDVPVFGAISVWRDGSTWQGHVAAVLATTVRGFDAMNFNSSNPRSKWRDGRFVIRKSHSGTVIETLKTGRHLRGFIDTRRAIEYAIKQLRVKVAA